MTTILDRIVANKRDEVERARRRMPFKDLERRLAQAPPIRDFQAALADPPGIQVIAEHKRASPSAGVIRAGTDAAALAKTYQDHGAACISVLTDGPFFQGSLDDLRQVRGAVNIPVLRKDFLLDSYQLLEARVAGADAVLLIAEILSDEQLSAMLRETQQLGMQALVEFYGPGNLARVLSSGAKLIGINNRNLHSFDASLQQTFSLAAYVPRDRCLVSESGISNRADVERLEQAGVKAILVGETLMRAADVGRKLRELLGKA